MSEKILVFNGYGSSNTQGPQVAQWVKDLGAKVALISELGRLDDDLRRVGNLYDAGDQPKDCAVLITGSTAVRIIDRVWRLTPFIRRGGDKPRLWRDRYCVRTRRGRRVDYALHANAAIQGPGGNWLDNPGADAWKDALIDLYATIKADVDRGLMVRVGGDFNFFDSKVGWSPSDFFTRLGMDWIDDGRVMYLGWTRSNHQVVSRRVLGRAPGADSHKALLVEVEKKPRVRR